MLLQYNIGQWKPVAYTSRSMSDSEHRYAQIEKEALTAIWVCEKFSAYTLSQHFEIAEGYKSLASLLYSKAFDSLPLRILLFQFHLGFI